MRFQSFAGTAVLALATTGLTEHIPPENTLWGPTGPPRTLEARQATATTSTATSTSSKVADSACSNGPLTRQCWLGQYSAATDFDAKWPTTGRTVSYYLELVNGTCNPDGSQQGKSCQLFNNQYPGPVITASKSR